VPPRRAQQQPRRGPETAASPSEVLASPSKRLASPSKRLASPSKDRPVGSRRRHLLSQGLESRPLESAPSAHLTVAHTRRVTRSVARACTRVITRRHTARCTHLTVAAVTQPAHTRRVTRSVARACTRVITRRHTARCTAAALHAATTARRLIQKRGGVHTLTESVDEGLVLAGYKGTKSPVSGSCSRAGAPPLARQRTFGALARSRKQEVTNTTKYSGTSVV
jgi:hypothetical protein